PELKKWGLAPAVPCKTREITRRGRCLSPFFHRRAWCGSPTGSRPSKTPGVPPKLRHYRRLHPTIAAFGFDSAWMDSDSDAKGDLRSGAMARGRETRATTCRSAHP